MSQQLGYEDNPGERQHLASPLKGVFPQGQAEVADVTWRPSSHACPASPSRALPHSLPGTSPPAASS